MCSTKTKTLGFHLPFPVPVRGLRTICRSLPYRVRIYVKNVPQCRSSARAGLRAFLYRCSSRMRIMFRYRLTFSRFSWTSMAGCRGRLQNESGSIASSIRAVHSGYFACQRRRGLYPDRKIPGKRSEYEFPFREKPGFGRDDVHVSIAGSCAKPGAVERARTRRWRDQPTCLLSPVRCRPFGSGTWRKRWKLAEIPQHCSRSSWFIVRDG